MTGKSAQGLSLNTIVIGAIVLIVLMVLIGIFTGYFGKFTPGFRAASEQKCDAGKGFEVKSECDELTEKEVVGNFGKDFPQGQKCCKKVTVSCDGGGIACRRVCLSGETKLDKNINGLEYVCNVPGEICCFLNSP